MNMPFTPMPPLITDSFAGGGGASTGIEMALGVSPDFAINHNEAALALHAANHPNTEHLVTSIYAVDPRELVKDGQKVGLAWFSPDCKHFSRARGGTPVNKNIRDLAWVVVHWAELVRPQVIALENVAEFKDWCPTRQKHTGGRPPKTPPKSHKEWEKLPPEEKGTPAFDKDGLPIMEPCPFRKGQTFKRWVRRLRALGYQVKWKELRACDYGSATIRKRLFIVARCDGRPIVWPKPTHGAPDSQDVKRGKLKPYRTAAENIDWSIPCPTIFMTKEEAKQYGRANDCNPPKRPLAEATLRRIARGMKRYVIDAQKPFVVSVAHGDSGGRREYAADAPFNTITAGGISHAIATPSLLSLKGSARRDFPANGPHPTVLAGGGHSALISPILTFAQHGGGSRPAEGPHHTITASTKDQNALLTPLLVQTGYGERKGQAPRSLDLFAPLGTVVAGGVKHASVSAFLAQHNKARAGVNPGRPIDAPISTLTATGSQQSMVAPWFAKYYGQGDGARCDEPLHTVTVKDRMGHMQAELTPVFTPEMEYAAFRVARFLEENGAWDSRRFVTVSIGDEEFVVVDIGMRMLTPRELYNCQGFPANYVIDGVWEQKGDQKTFRAFPKKTQVSCVGNSVCPQVAAALIEANCQHLIEELRAAA